MVRCTRTVAFGVLSLAVLAGFVEAQTAGDSAQSAIVSRPPEGIKPGSIKPEPKAPDASDDSSISIDPMSLVPDLPALPKANASLIGGLISRVDRVRDQLTIQVFGGGKTTVLFDPRSQVFAGTKPGSIADLREGQRIYVDTILDGQTIFARNIRLSSNAAMGQSQGVILKYRADRGELTVHDGISPAPIRVRLTSATKVTRNGQAVPSSNLAEGTLISMDFSSEGNGHDTARDISILALPGSQFTFVGQVVHLDLRSGLLVLNSSTDRKTYEIHLNPAMSPDDNLHTGSEVTVIANFEGARYVARNITINSSNK